MRRSGAAAGSAIFFAIAPAVVALSGIEIRSLADKLAAHARTTDSGHWSACRPVDADH
jgi:hypothetical protein